MPSIGLCRFDPHIMHQLFAYQWKRDPPAFFVFISFIVQFVRVLRFSSLPSSRERHRGLARRVRSRRHSKTDSRPTDRSGNIASWPWSCAPLSVAENLHFPAVKVVHLVHCAVKLFRNGARRNVGAAHVPAVDWSKAVFRAVPDHRPKFDLIGHRAHASPLSFSIQTKSFSWMSFGFRFQR